MPIMNADKDSFDEMIKEGFVIVDMYGEDCNPCKMFAKVLEELSYELDFVNVVKVNTTFNQELAKRFDVTAVPTIFFMKDGEIAERHLGFMNMDQLKEKIGNYLY